MAERPKQKAIRKKKPSFWGVLGVLTPMTILFLQKDFLNLSFCLFLFWQKNFADFFLACYSFISVVADILVFSGIIMIFLILLESTSKIRNFMPQGASITSPGAGIL